MRSVCGCLPGFCRSGSTLAVPPSQDEDAFVGQDGSRATLPGREPGEGQADLETILAAAAAASSTIDRDPLDRSGDRAMARAGLLDDAQPLFADAQDLARAGVLLAVPLLARHGLLETFEEVLGAKLSAPGTAPQRTVKGFKIAQAGLRRQLAAAEARVTQLTQQRGQLSTRVPASDLQHLKTEKKLIVDAIKIAVYQVETELLGMLGEHYARTADQGRTFRPPDPR